MAERTITILCSGVALGVYVPALLLRHRLRELGLGAEVAVLEDLYSDAGLESLERLRETFHRRFELAKMAQRMTRSAAPSLERARVEELLEAWRRGNRRELVVWSGFWLPVIEEYRTRCAPDRVETDLCRIDATVSASFRGAPAPGPDDREIWFWNRTDRRLEHELGVAGPPPIPFAEREDRLVVHGGGWGLGEQDRAAAELAAAGMALDRVLYRREEASATNGSSRHFMVRPDWRPWRRPPGEEPELPPFGEVTRGESDARFVNRPECHELYLLIRRSRAIVSKPGGGTLLDSLASATPVVFLEPYGEAEESNAELWTWLGFGISLPDWRRTGYDPRVLEGLHAKLLKGRDTTRDYPAAIAGRASRTTAHRAG